MDIVSQTVSPMHARTDHADDFRAMIRMVDLGVTQLSVMSFPSLEAHRPGLLIRRSDPEVYIIAVNLRGQSEVTQEDQSVILGRYDMTIYDSSHPTRSVARGNGGKRGSAAVMLVPRAVVPVPANQVRRRLITRRMSGSGGVGAVLLHHLMGLVRHADGLARPDAGRLATTTVDLLSAVLARELDDDARLPIETRERVLMANVYAFINQHLSDPALSPQTVAAAHHVSTRTLHRLFQEQGTSVSRWIRRQRLEGCRRDLAQARPTQPIRSVAARWGFTDWSHFARTFRAEYGVSPQHYRALLAIGEAPA
ncbi:helix-turn-helix domain-containing protein [Micromonospora ureilytica]|uniref:helix-turn-helix domain-containing protein n=1 Tax=Micromonospora ureilytica TaxID=709868 RepID=UPI0033CD1873